MFTIYILKVNKKGYGSILHKIICEWQNTEKQWQRGTHIGGGQETERLKASTHAISEPSPPSPPGTSVAVKMRDVMPLDHADKCTTNSCNLLDTENQHFSCSRFECVQTPRRSVSCTAGGFSDWYAMITSTEKMTLALVFE